MPLDRVTITGADDNTDIAEMQELSGIYPFVEWGVLASKSREGSSRYPGRGWCNALAAVAYDDDLMKISVHICGAWARQVFDGSINMADLPAVRRVARRFQINGMPASGAGDAQYEPDSLRQFIFQYPRAAGYMMQARGSGVSVAPLFDESGGDGISNVERWTDLDMPYVGYAGGNGPENIVERIERIQSFRSGAFWVDMEGRMRDSDGRLDMQKCWDVLRLCAPMVVGL